MYGSGEAQFEGPELYSWELGLDVHVWRFPVVPTNFYFLNEDERTIAQRFRFEEDRLRFSVGRQSLRLLISKYLLVQPQEITFSGERNQKPFIIQPSSRIHFNISHSGGWVLIAIANVELGVDIELVDEDFAYPEILAEHFSGEERDFITGTADPLQAFYYLWTRKEALTKAWGTGLQENLKSANMLSAASWVDTKNKLWKVDSFLILSNYWAALAYPIVSTRVLYFDGRGLLF
jgi:4'-phosphopantetheinyl transferase